ncbi:hypothetical protein [uncultured Jatrophihabitans sp.]|uniref:hypothetical protein n=1 Tax=uncultured Jatrophihabitans sp. TaxID=1610747 RepID=UPI0035CC0CC4
MSSPALGPPPTGSPPPHLGSARPPRRTVAGWTAAAVLTVVVIVIGVVVAMNLSSSASSGPSLAELERIVDRAPLPPGSVLVDETRISAKGDRTAHVDRRYRLQSATPGADVRSLLAAHGYRLANLRTGAVEPVESSDWSDYASAATGDVNVVPPDHGNGSIEYSWQGAELSITANGGDF